MNAKAQRGALILIALAVMCSGIGVIWGWGWSLFWFGMLVWISI